MLFKNSTPEEFVGIAIFREHERKPQVLFVRRFDDTLYQLPGGLVWRNRTICEKTAVVIAQRIGVTPIGLTPVLFVSGFNSRLISSENRGLFDFDETQPARNASFYATFSFSGTPLAHAKGGFEPPVWMTIEPALFTKKCVILTHHEGLKQACRWAMQKSEAFYYFGSRNQRILDPVL